MNDPTLRIANAVRHAVVDHHERAFLTPLYLYVISRVEKPLIEEALRLNQRNCVRAARALGINRNTLLKKMRLYGVTR